MEGLRQVVARDVYDQCCVTSKIFGAAHPFTSHLADGRKIRVQDGDHLSAQPEGLVLMLWKPKGDVKFVNLTMVTALEGKKLSEKISE